jgi:DnaJ like chaperone protein
MQWLGKSIGGVIGAAIAGPIGSLIGVLVGHQWDQQSASWRRRPSTTAISQLFFEVAFEIMGRVAKIDGRVSEDEIRVAQFIMRGMNLSPEQTRGAIDCFTRGKSGNYPMTERLAALAAQIGDRADLARAFVQLQLQAAIGAGVVGPDKRELLLRVAATLGVSRSEFAQLEAIVRAFMQQGRSGPTPAQTLAEAYRVLGVSPTASDDAVKTAYRRLMSQHHPDKLVARGLPESMKGIAEQKTQEVRAAYERIKTQRGLK